MGDLDNEKVKVYVLDACSDECTCSEDECKAERLCEELKQCPECENIEWMFGREWSTESSFLDKVYNSIWRSKNVLILWNTNSRKFVERNEQPKRLCRTLSRSEDENANKTDICLAKFANFYQNTSYVQVDKGYGNVLVHVKLEENAIPKYVRKWEDATTGSAIDIIARIRGMRDLFYHDVDEIFWPQPIRLLKLGHVTGRGCMSPTWLCFYQTRSAWSMDQGWNKNHSPINNFTNTVTKFCVMWEGQALPHDTKFCNCMGQNCGW